MARALRGNLALAENAIGLDVRARARQQAASERLDRGGASPRGKVDDDAVARDEDGFILTGAAANADSLLETSVPGVIAAGDVRSGSIKRCATAVGEGAMAVQLVHARLAQPSR